MLFTCYFLLDDMKNIKINGMKLGKYSIRATQQYFIENYDVPLYKSLSDEYINISFLNIDFTSNHKYISCSLASESDVEAGTLGTDITESVCSLSVYPHKFSLTLLFYFICLLIKRRYKFYDFVTSNSMLTFIIDQNSGKELCDYLSHHITLPLSHISVQQYLNSNDSETMAKARPESSASYFEKKIKTYGISTRTDLDLYCLNTEFDYMEKYTRKLQSSINKNVQFYYASAHISSNNKWCLFFLMHKKNRYLKNDLLTGVLSKNLAIIPSVELIFFQGPHFGDRYGIANQAVSILNNAGIPILLSGFTGSCIYMVLSQGGAQKDKQNLLKVFEKP